MTQPHDLERELAQLIIETLNLEDITPDDIEPEAPLFREGLGLDSIDALEIALAVSRQYGIQLKSDDENNTQIFRSLRALAQHIAASRP
ncbi:MAG: phosphopantetheine-binding protein [Gammaproteobacteria bacterium]|nr:phosphopantetheine-binding protein [Gammaproteobacteria bacterium]